MLKIVSKFVQIILIVHPLSALSQGYQQPCNSGVERSDVRIRTVEQIPRTEIAHMAAVARSPLVVGLHAEGSLQFYQSGIVTSCSPYPNHAVTLVGYSSALIDRQTGREQFKAVKEADMPRMWKLDYFLIRNSWGSGWYVFGGVKS